MSIDQAKKIVNRDAVATNSEGREKTFLRKLFEGPNANGHVIPHPVLWRAKAMQCEGVGEDWVSMLQRKVSAEVTDAEMSNASALYPLNTPHTKEEFYYRRIFEEHYAGMAHVVNPWVGGCRAGGAEWKSDAYTREGLGNTNLLTHAFQQKSGRAASFSTSAGQHRSFASMPAFADLYASEDEAIQNAQEAGFSLFESYLTSGSDDRSMIDAKTGENSYSINFCDEVNDSIRMFSYTTGTNKYHVKPQPISKNDIFRGSCTCNVPTQSGYDAAMKLFDEKLSSLTSQDDLEKALREIFDQQRKRITASLQLPDGVEVVLSPIGEDKIIDIRLSCLYISQSFLQILT